MPLTDSFCADRIRVRIACSGRMYLCLGGEEAVDLREMLRASANDEVVAAAIREAVAREPKRYEFGKDGVNSRPPPSHSVSLTGG